MPHQAKKIFFIFIFSLSAGLFTGVSSSSADTLTIYTYPAPDPLNWKSPSALTWSVVLNGMPVLPEGGRNKYHFIGHTNIELRCSSTPIDDSVYVFTGMTSEGGTEERDLLLKKHYGMGLMFHNFRGKLMDRDRALMITETLKKTGRMSFLMFQISSDTCQRLADYYQEWKDREYFKDYGLPNRPRYGEGSGCSAFASSFLEVGGLMEGEFRSEWTRSKKVQLKDIGGEMTGRKVRVWSLLFPTKKTRWARPGEPQAEVTFWDPELIHNWIVQKYEEQENTTRPQYRTMKWGNAKGLLIDRRHVLTPGERFWLHELGTVRTLDTFLNFNHFGF